MADVTVTQFADVLKVPVDKLLSQLEDAGIKVDGSEDIISDEAKMELLTYLRRSHGMDEGNADGTGVGRDDGSDVGAEEGSLVGSNDGLGVGTSEGGGVGLRFASGKSNSM